MLFDIVSRWKFGDVAYYRRFLTYLSGWYELGYG